MTDFRISLELRSSLLAYMYARPYGEVCKGIWALEALEPLNELEPEPETESGETT